MKNRHLKLLHVSALAGMCTLQFSLVAADAHPGSQTAATGAQHKNFVNPRVQAGLVSWHGDLKTACAQAKASKKPVLLFQMMGRLDDEFC